jgi:hypothetical protein
LNILENTDEGHLIIQGMEDALIENEYVKIWIEDGILFMIYKKEQIDLPYAKNVVESRMQVSGGKSYPVFVDLNKVKGVTKDARGFLAGDEAANLISASALWGVHEIIKMLTNFYLALNKPDVPAKFFNDRQKALEWLKKYK